MKTILTNFIRCAHLRGLAMAWCVLIFTQPLAQAESIDDPVNVRFILPGMTEVLDIVQTGSFPLGAPQFLIFVLGQGTLAISLKNDNTTAKETIFMMGVAQSRAGTYPIYRLGTSKGMISQTLEVGTTGAPYGFVWLYCGVSLADKGPVYLYELRLSFVP